MAGDAAQDDEYVKKTSRPCPVCAVPTFKSGEMTHSAGLNIRIETHAVRSPWPTLTPRSSFRNLTHLLNLA